MPKPPLLLAGAHFNKVDSAWVDYVYSFIEEFAISAVRDTYHHEIDLYKVSNQINEYISQNKTPGPDDKFAEVDLDAIVKALAELSRNGRSGYAEFKNDEVNIQLPNCNRNTLKPRVYQVCLNSLDLHKTLFCKNFCLKEVQTLEQLKILIKLKF